MGIREENRKKRNKVIYDNYYKKLDEKEKKTFSKLLKLLKQEKYYLTSISMDDTFDKRGLRVVMFLIPRD